MNPTAGNTISTDVRSFFSEFERTSNELDPTAVTEQFEPTFLSADPNGVIAVPREAFLAALPRRKAVFEDAGIGQIRLVDLEQTDLDQHYVLVRTEWLADANESPLPMSSTFLLHRDGTGRLTVAVYLNHTDILATVQARSARAN